MIEHDTSQLPTCHMHERFNPYKGSQIKVKCFSSMEDVVTFVIESRDIDYASTFGINVTSDNIDCISFLTSELDRHPKPPEQNAMK